jgi:hypothetical protein
VSFEVGKIYKTVDGRDVIILQVVAHQQVIGALHCRNGDWVIFAWYTSTGERCGKTGPRGDNLRMPRPPVVVSDAVAQAYNNNAYRNYYSKVALAAAITVYLAEQDSK